MEWLYQVLLKLLYPTSLSVMLLPAAAALRKRRIWSRVCFWLGLIILLVCGNGWVVGQLTGHLERKYLPPNPVPQSDCIIILSGGIASQIPPRPTIELGVAGQRILYGAYLYRQGKAPRIICTGDGTGGSANSRPAAEDMAEFLKTMGVPEDAIIVENKAANTHEHARNLYPMLQKSGYKHILLVTSATHMPRSVGVFRRLCPGIEFIPAPTDFRTIEEHSSVWYHKVAGLIPTPSQLAGFSDAMHEYLGMAYYRIKGWI